MNQKSIKQIILFLIAAGIFVFLPRCSTILFGYEEEEVHTSPEGTNTVIVKYDLVSRPDVFKKGRLWDKKIWDYPGKGFMETVHFGVEWLSESEILLTYDDVTHDENDEEYIIRIP